jgi:hypothetical protein
MGVVMSTIKFDRIQKFIKPYFGYSDVQPSINKTLEDCITREELNDYFKQIINAMDYNLDELVTKKDLELYVYTQLKNSNEEIEKWKKSYELLQDRYDKLLDTVNSNSNTNPNLESRDIHSNISIQSLKDYIEKEIMEDPDTNLRLIPDPLERKIYLTVYKTIMKSLEKVCNTTSIDLLNHRLTFNLNHIK